MNPNQPSTDYAPYPKIDPNDVAPPPPVTSASDSWTSVPVGSQPQTTASPPPPPPATATGQPMYTGGGATTMPTETNPYVSPAPVPTSSTKSGTLSRPIGIFGVGSKVMMVVPSFFSTIESVKDVLGKWGKAAADATKKGQDYAGEVWQHLKTGPSITDAAVGRIAQGTKALTEGGYEKIFASTFETVPDEKLLKYYPCYLSTSAGPVMGILYMSTAKLAFSSDNPLSYKVGDETQWSYYKVVIPLHQLKAVNPSKSKANPAEKYIQIISVDNHEFWFMGFVNYDSAVKYLQGALQSCHPV